MDYTPIHRLLGAPPGLLTSDLLNEAVAAGLAETRDLDWKRSLPEAPGSSDFPKDIAAMANTGGGMIVYGVIESNKLATDRFDVGDVSEAQERTLRAVAGARISPPVLNLRIERIGSEDELPRALVVIVPPSPSAPHLVSVNQGFSAPVRNDADTFWMGEPELAAAYRTRFDEERDAELELSRLYDWARRRALHDERAWLVAVARPKVQPPRTDRLSGREARDIVQAGQLAASHIRRPRLSVFDLLDLGSPRPGLRRQVFRTFNGGAGYRDARMSLHDRGSVTLDMAIGGAPTGSVEEPGTKVNAAHLEGAIVDFVCVVKAAAEHHGWGDFDIDVGVEWDGSDPLHIVARDAYGFEEPDWSTPLQVFEHVRSSLRFEGDDSALELQTRELALDAINQAGLAVTSAFLTADPEH